MEAFEVLQGCAGLLTGHDFTALFNGPFSICVLLSPVLALLCNVTNPRQVQSSPKFATCQVCSNFLEVYLLRPFYQVYVKCDFCVTWCCLSVHSMWSCFQCLTLLHFVLLVAVVKDIVIGYSCCDIAHCFKSKPLWPSINKRSNDSTSTQSWEVHSRNELALCWAPSCPVNRQRDRLQRFRFTLLPLAQHLRIIIGCYKNLAWIMCGWLHIDWVLVGCVVRAVTEHLRAFAAGLQFPAPCSLGGMTVCPQNWLTEGYFPNDSGCSCPKMNDLLYFKWQADCFHSTLTPGSAAVTLFSGSGASVIKRGGGNRRCRFSLGLRETERNACFLQVKATVGLWSEARQLRFQRSCSFWFSSNSTISAEARLLVDRFPLF